MSTAKSPSAWDRHVAALVAGPVLTGGAILPTQVDGPASARKSVIYAQKGLSMRVPEAAALIEAIMDGKVHKDYVNVGGQQCVPLSPRPLRARLTRLVPRCRRADLGDGVRILRHLHLLRDGRRDRPRQAEEGVGARHVCSADYRCTGHTACPPEGGRARRVGLTTHSCV